jgi:hypothetical protein
MLDHERPGYSPAERNDPVFAAQLRYEQSLLFDFGALDRQSVSQTAIMVLQIDVQPISTTLGI